jgi:hypothetical protein
MVFFAHFDSLISYIIALANLEAILKSAISSRFYIYIYIFSSYASYLSLSNMRLGCYNFVGGLATPKSNRGGCGALKNRSEVVWVWLIHPWTLGSGPATTRKHFSFLF